MHSQVLSKVIQWAIVDERIGRWNTVVEDCSEFIGGSRTRTIFLTHLWEIGLRSKSQSFEFSISNGSSGGLKYLCRFGEFDCTGKLVLNFQEKTLENTFHKN